MEIINVDNKHKVNYESDLKQFLTEGGFNFDHLILQQYNLCCELFDQKFGRPVEEPINKGHSVTFSSNDWEKALLLLPGDQCNHISWLVSVIQEDHQVVKTLKFQQSGEFCFLLVQNCDIHVVLVPIYLLFKKKTNDIPWRQSQFDVKYQEQVYQLNDATTKQLFPQNEANCSSGTVTQSQHHNSGYRVNYRDEGEFAHGKSITDIVEYALRTMGVPEGKITSRQAYEQIIDNMSSKLGHPTPYLENYENIQESQSIVPYDLRSLVSKTRLFALLFGSNNQVDTRMGQEMTQEEVVLTASKEGQCLDIGVVYLKVDVETKKVRGILANSTKEKKTLHYEKMTFSMPRHKVQIIASQLN